MAFSSTIVNQIITTQSDTNNPTLFGQLTTSTTYRHTLLEGSGNGSGNISYAISGTIGAGSTVSYDLQSLTRSFFGATQTFKFTNVKSLHIINYGSGTADILLVGSGSNPFTPWGYASGTSIVERIEPYSVFSKTNGIVGWETSATSKNLNIKNLSSSGIYHYIQIVGASGY